ncbi:uncharacterized protein LOC111915375 [Lactuca sativa]|uniref:uncharacterized protein LOC111915375 n=1 Tax=Lactuca sativa TaxID=4236 RepID=UPI000CD98F57|nr:uncharacterized protein LOC111915375 [Lactuca sativa]
MSILGRNRSQTLFYTPPAMRSHNQQPEFCQEEKQVSPQKEDQSESFLNSNSSHNVEMSNLDRFMKMSTPIVTAQHFPKTSIKGWRNEEHYQPYFILDDLWETYTEWSAYGAGVPLVLNEKDYVVQYYTPYISAIQLYIDPSPPFTNSRRAGEQSDSGSSDGSYEGGAAENNPDSVAQSFNKLMLDEHEFRSPHGLLAYEFYEKILPFHRRPLVDKVSDLAKMFPAIRSYRSCDLTPSSWFSVAWYPIYRIPHGPSLHEVESCFLTYHSLSSPVKGMDGDNSNDGGHGHGQLSLPIFGFSVYKFRSCDWIPNVHGVEKVNSLIHSTDNWLRMLGVFHPDFMHFKTRAFLQ